MLGFEMMVDGPDGAARREAFEQAMDKYIFEYLDHIHTEERVILPLAERVLTTADWLELDAAFMQNRDPLTRREGDDAYRPLFKRILMTAAAPIGLGPAMEAMRQSFPRPDAPLARPLTRRPGAVRSGQPSDEGKVQPAGRVEANPMTRRLLPLLPHGRGLPPLQWIFTPPAPCRSRKRKRL